MYIYVHDCYRVYITDITMYISLNLPSLPPPFCNNKNTRPSVPPPPPTAPTLPYIQQQQSLVYRCKPPNLHYKLHVWVYEAGGGVCAGEFTAVWGAHGRGLVASLLGTLLGATAGLGLS